MDDKLHAEIVAYKKRNKIPSHVKHKSNFQKVAGKYGIKRNHLTRDSKRVITEKMLPGIWKCFHGRKRKKYF